MDVSNIVTRLGAVGSLAQVVEADPGGYTTPVDASTALVTALDSLVASEVYPLTLLDEPEFPNIVYQMVQSQVGEIDGYTIIQSDVYVLEARADSYDGMISLFGSIVTALDGMTLSTEVQDAAFDYEDDKKMFRASMQVEISYLSLPSQAMPVAFVYPLNRDATESSFDNWIKQQLTNEYGIVLVTDAGNIPTLQDDVMERLLGWQQAADWHEMEYVAGSSIEGTGQMEVWREIYTDSNYAEQL